MSVLIVTSVGDIVVDLNVDRCPLTCKNFLKLCKMKYYNGCLFHKVEKDFLAQTGDPTGTGAGGDSVYKFLYGEQARFFEDEIHPDLRHKRVGTVGMASAGENCNASQFYFTLREDIDYLDDKHTIFGVVEEKEGVETLAKINESYVDDKGRPFKDIRIKHTYILDDPFDDPPQLSELIPENSPEGKPVGEVAEERLEDSWVPLDETLGPEEVEERLRAKEARTNAAILESIGDIPDVDIKPPENVLFVCKLNPVTEDEDLFTIFSRFGTVTSAEIIRDFKTGDSLCYAFIEFEAKEACERAYFKMDNCLIDDRRIHVDFSQSVSKLWGQYRQGKRNANKDGCFKCGASDHIARDCNQGSQTGHGGQKYVLKDDNAQRGGENSQRYDMVFDEDNAEMHKGREEEWRENGTKRRKVDLDREGRDLSSGGGSRRGRDDGNRGRQHEGDGSRRAEKKHFDDDRRDMKEKEDPLRDYRHNDDKDDHRRSNRHYRDSDRRDNDLDYRDRRDHHKRRDDDKYHDRRDGEKRRSDDRDRKYNDERQHRHRHR